jgi:hypothetical protein
MLFDKADDHNHEWNPRQQYSDQCSFQIAEDETEALRISPWLLSIDDIVLIEIFALKKRMTVHLSRFYTKLSITLVQEKKTNSSITIHLCQLLFLKERKRFFYYIDDVHIHSQLCLMPSSSQQRT